MQASTSAVPIMHAGIRSIVASVLYGASLAALSAQYSPPPKLEPLPDVPPPPPEIANDPELQPQVTVTRRDNETVEEYRVNGRVTMVKVTPRHGKPYFLMADGPDGALSRRESLDSGVKVPLWLLFSF
jgi:hypothetical protein